MRMLGLQRHLGEEALRFPRLLIVDDEESLCLFHERIFFSAWIQCRHSQRNEEAEKMVESRNIVIISGLAAWYNA